MHVCVRAHAHARACVCARACVQIYMWRSCKGDWCVCARACVYASICTRSHARTYRAFPNQEQRGGAFLSKSRQSLQVFPILTTTVNEVKESGKKTHNFHWIRPFLMILLKVNPVNRCSNVCRHIFETPIVIILEPRKETASLTWHPPPHHFGPPQGYWVFLGVQKRGAPLASLIRK